MRACLSLGLLAVLFILSCDSQPISNKRSKSNKLRADSLEQLDLEDSERLVLIKDLFYRSKGGHLYQKTIAQVFDDNVHDSLMWREYFNGTIPQDIDPLTFESLDGWYANDKNSIYYYRPMSGGMHISKMDSADRGTFSVLRGHYLYAVDKNHVYRDHEIIDSLYPADLKTSYDEKGNFISLQSAKKIYMIDKIGE